MWGQYWGFPLGGSLLCYLAVGIMERGCPYWFHCSYLGTEASQVVSGFLTKGIDLCIAVETVCPWGKWRSKAFYFILLKSHLVKLFNRWTPTFHFFSSYSLFDPTWLLSLSQLKNPLALLLNPTEGFQSLSEPLPLTFGLVNQPFHKILFFLEFCWHHTLLDFLLPLGQCILFLNRWLSFLHLLIKSWSASCFNSVSSLTVKSLTSDSSDR